MNCVETSTIGQLVNPENTIIAVIVNEDSPGPTVTEAHRPEASEGHRPTVVWVVAARDFPEVRADWSCAGVDASREAPKGLPVGLGI